MVTIFCMDPEKLGPLANGNMVLAEFTRIGIIEDGEVALAVRPEEITDGIVVVDLDINVPSSLGPINVARIILKRLIKTLGIKDRRFIAVGKEQISVPAGVVRITSWEELPDCLREMDKVA